MKLSQLLAACAVPIATAWAEFTFGVASGDVTDRAAIVWTRTDEPRNLLLKLTRDATFGTLDREVAITTAADSDSTAKLDLTDLTPATRYYYRFEDAADASVVSDVGQFKTLAASDVALPMRFAFSGDTNFAVAPFGVVASLAREPVDLFIWFGDTIYADVPAGGLGVAQTLDEYRAKYRQIRSDPSIRSALAAMPIWTGGDDHEVENDYAGLDPDLSAAQRADAYQAFFEYMPIRNRGDASDPYRLYRNYRHGSLAEFFFLDARQYRDASASDDCGGALDPLGTVGGLLTYDGACANELKQPRAFLGRTQLDWLKDGLAASTAPWQFIVNNVPFSYLGVFPYDRWDGYDAERQELLEFIHAQRIAGVVILTTDIHANAIVPDTSVYFRNNRSDYALRDDIRVPEIIVGPLGNATARQSVAGIAESLLGERIGRFVVEIAEGFLTLQLSKFDRIAYIDTNRVSYVVINVESPDTARVTYRGLSPEESNDATLAAETLHTADLNDAPGSACALPVVGSLALLIASMAAGRRATR